MTVAFGSAGSPISIGAVVESVTSVPTGFSEPSGTSVPDGSDAEESVVTTVVAGTVVEPSVGTDVAACGKVRDGPPGAVVVTASDVVAAGSVVELDVESDVEVVVVTPSARVVEDPSATVVLEVSTGAFGAANRTGRSRTAPVT
jgi:hypothetical protein